MSRFFKLLRYLKPFKWKVAQNVLYNVLGAFFALFSFAMIIPFLWVLFDKEPVVNDLGDFEFKASYIRQASNYYLGQIMMNQGKVRTMFLVSFAVITFSLLKNGFLYLANYVLAPVRANTVRNIRNDIYRKLLVLPLGYFTESKKGDVIARVSSDVQEIEVSIMSSMQMLFRDPITIVIFLGFLIATNWLLTLIVLVILPISGLLIGMIGRNLRKKSFRGQEYLGSLMSILEETLGGLRIVKGFNGEQKMDDRFSQENQRFAGMMKKVIRRRQLAGPMSEFLGTIVLMILMTYGGWMVLSGNYVLSSENLIFFLIVFSQILNPVKNLSTAWFSVQKGMASVDRIDVLLDADKRISELPDATELKSFESGIEFHNVCFSYGKEDVLRHVDLKVKKGDLIAIVGKSGAGKSTLVDLLPRFIDPQEGEVRIDGVDIKSLKLKDVRKLMGIVSQQSILFNDSFKNNIAFGVEEASDEAVMEAARVANALEFINEYEEGIEAGVGEGGGKLSGGQKQRISIARAVMANPPILILDEATSALDTESEVLVQEAIEKLMKNRTSIVIAHRLSTIRNADKIVVMDEGRIVEQGKHDELLKIENGVYKKLHGMQVF